MAITQVITSNTTAQNATPDSGQKFTGITDCDIDLSVPTTNHGTLTPVQISKYAAGNWQSMLIKADLSNVPAGANVSSAILYLRTAGGSHIVDMTYNMFKLSRNWVVSQATWNIYSTGNNWGTAGALNASDRAASTTDTYFASSATDPAGTGYWMDFDVTSDMASLLAGNNFGWIIERNGAGNDTNYLQVHTTESATDGKRPELVIVYTAGGLLRAPGSIMSGGMQELLGNLG